MAQPLRYVIYGAGAIGGTIGGRLAEAGHSVTLIARGRHLDAIQRDGLTLIRPDAETNLKIPAVSSPEEAEIRPNDVIIMAVKTQDSESILSRLGIAAPPSARIVSAQNGIESERSALRRFADVYGMCVMVPADHLEPGVVLCFGSPVSGILDLGRFPHGTDDVAVRIAQDLTSSGFASEAVDDIMRLKAGKLMLNLHNVVDALGGVAALETDLPERARAEAADVLRAAGLDYASKAEDTARRKGVLERRPAGGHSRSGGSTWQSLARGTGSTETDFFNGEIVLLGRLHGVPTPVNAALQRAMHSFIRSGGVAGSLDPVRLVELFEANLQQ